MTIWRSCATSSVAGFKIRHAADVLQGVRRRRGIAPRLDDLCETASHAIRSRRNDSDSFRSRQIDKDYAPIPSLLATSGVHHHLVREGTRTKATLIVETGEAREVHHYCLLIGYGASAINPYLAFETLDDMIRQTPADRHRSSQGRQVLHQGREQGRAEGHVEDGHLDAAKLSRSADLRSDRLEPEVRRHLFHQHAVTHQRHRPRRNCGGSRSERHRRAFPDTARAPARISTGAGNISGVRTASTTCTTRRRSTSCSTPRARTTTRSSRNTATLMNSHEPEAVHAARTAGSEVCRSSRFRSMKSNRSNRS